jgi:hypothetical protein
MTVATPDAFVIAVTGFNVPRVLAKLICWFAVTKVLLDQVAVTT